MEPSQRLFIVFDTEGTGLQKQALSEMNVPSAITMRGSEVCQIGGIILDERMMPLKLFCHYCDIVAADSHPGAQRVHGIQMREVRQHLLGKYLPEVLTTHLPEFFYDNVIFIGYNSDFDMTCVAQTTSNSPFSFTWSPFRGTLIPKRGRYSVDVAEYVKTGDRYRKLSSFENELFYARESFLHRYAGVLTVETNCIELLEPTWKRAHNSFFDALNTFLLWGERVWKKKLL